MRGAREYYSLFKNGETIGKLRIRCGSHARGAYFHVYVVDGNESVEVYGILGGQPGWTEYYGWLKEGKWVDDFNALVSNRKAIKEMQGKNDKKEAKRAKEKQEKKENEILESY
jgi:hypothetical protein